MPDVGITISAQDKASAVLRNVGDTGARSLGKLEVSGKAVSNTIKQMPEQLGKSAAAMLLFQNSMSQVGGKAADVANKLTAVVGLVATGGPIGAGLAALTLGISAASAAWDVFTTASRHAEEAQKTLQAVLDASNQRLRDGKERVKALTEELAYFGQTAAEIAIQKQRELVAATEEGIRKTQEEITSIEWNGRAFRELNAEQQALVDKKRADMAQASKHLAQRREELTLLEDLAGARAIEKRDEEAKIARANRIREAERKRAEEERQYAADRMEWLNQEMQTQQAFMEQEKRQNEERNAMIDRLVAKRRKAAEMQLALDESIARSGDEAMRKTEAVGNAVNRSVSVNVEGVLSGTKSVGAAAASTSIDVAETAIMTSAASAAAKQLDAHAYIPFVGIAIGTAFATAIFAAARAYMSKFEFGGVVRGGTPNQDSVPALLTPGEVVLTQQQAKSLGEKGGSGNTTINANITAPVGSPSGMSETDTRRWILGWVKQLEALKKSGLVEI